MTPIIRVAVALVLAGCAHARTSDEYAADTQKSLADKAPEIEACYNRVLATTPTAAGRVTVSFVVEADSGHFDQGRVDAAQTTAPQEVSECVLAAIPAVAISPPDRKQGQASWVWEFQRPDQLRMR
jgi:hypothetical protein